MSLYLLLRRTDQKLLDEKEEAEIKGLLKMLVVFEKLKDQIEITDNNKLFRQYPDLKEQVSGLWNTNSTTYTVFFAKIADEEEDVIESFIVPKIKRKYRLDAIIYEEKLE